MKVLSNEELTRRLLSLEQAFQASTKRAVDNTYTAESANSKADALTPYTETKTAYIGDRSIDFVGIPEGNITVFGIEQNYKMTKTGSYLFIEWETPLEEVTQITISIS